MDQTLLLPLPSHLLMTELLLLQEGIQFAPVWSSLINIHVRNAPDTDLIYASAFFVPPELWKGVLRT